MPLQTFTAQSGIAKQASKGTLAADADFAHGLTGGSPISVESTNTPIEVTAARRVQFNVIREHVANGASIETFAYLRSLGLYLLGALGTDTVTGSAPNYVHTYSTGDLPYLSVFAKGFDATNQGIRDCKVDELTLKWEGNKPVDLSVKLAGTVFSYPALFSPASVNISSISFTGGVNTVTTATAHGLSVGSSLTITGATNPANNGVFTVATSISGTVFTVSNANGVAQAGAGGTVTAWVDETGSESFLVATGGTFQIDTTGSTLASARVISGELTIKNNVAEINPAATIESDDQWEGVQEHSLKLTIVPDNLNEFRKIITGTTAGTSAANFLPTGSISLLFKENGTGTGQLLVTASKVAFSTAFPDADPKGGAVEIELAGIAVNPVGGVVPVTYALTNNQAAY